MPEPPLPLGYTLLAPQKVAPAPLSPALGGAVPRLVLPPVPAKDTAPLPSRRTLFMEAATTDAPCELAHWLLESIYQHAVLPVKRPLSANSRSYVLLLAASRLPLALDTHTLPRRSLPRSKPLPATPQLLVWKPHRQLVKSVHLLLPPQEELGMRRSSLLIVAKAMFTLNAPRTPPRLPAAALPRTPEWQPPLRAAAAVSKLLMLPRSLVRGLGNIFKKHQSEEPDTPVRASRRVRPGKSSSSVLTATDRTVRQQDTPQTLPCHQALLSLTPEKELVRRGLVRAAVQVGSPAAALVAASKMPVSPALAGGVRTLVLLQPRSMLVVSMTTALLYRSGVKSLWTLLLVNSLVRSLAAGASDVSHLPGLSHLLTAGHWTPQRFLQNLELTRLSLHAANQTPPSTHTEFRKPLVLGLADLPAPNLLPRTHHLHLQSLLLEAVDLQGLPRPKKFLPNEVPAIRALDIVVVTTSSSVFV